MSRPAILAVDDDPQVLQAVVRDLRARYSKDYRILRAGSGAEAVEALDALRSRDGHVALVVSDQRMPAMDGVTFLREARDRYPSSKRALLTAYSDIEAAISAINDSQVDYYLLKPWDPPEQKLYPVLDDLLDDWQAGHRPGFEGIRIVGDRWSALAHQLRDFLARNHIPYTFHDVETDDQARDLAGEADQSAMPIVILSDGTRLERPTPADVATHVGLKTQAQQPFYDLAIVGGGPAGLATAVYGGSEGLRTILVESDSPGGQAGTSSRIENYLGFPAGLSGSDLARRAVAQTRKFGVEVLSPREVSALRVDGPYRHLVLPDGSEVSCHAVMLSMGVSWRLLESPGADRFTDRGLFYGAALTEATECRGRTTYTVGAGNSAGQAAMFFANYAETVVMLIRGDSLEAKMSQYLVDRIRSTTNIEVRLHAEITGFAGDQWLESITIQDTRDGSQDECEASHVFVFIGAAPRTEWLRDQVATDEKGFILTGPDLGPEAMRGWPLKRDPYLLETNLPGVFAAGDVRHESVKRVASAVGEGSVAVHFIHRHLASL